MSNVHNRLRIAFGNKYGVKIESIVNKGTIVHLIFPPVAEIEDINIGKDTEKKNEQTDRKNDS